MPYEYFDHKPELLAGFVDAPAKHNGDGYCHLSLTFGYLSASARQFDRAHGNDPLDQLEVTAMVGPDGIVYGWNLRYGSLYRVTILDLEPRVKLLRAINHKLGAWEKQWGEPATFGQYALRICKALGVHAYLQTSHRPEVDETWQTWDMSTLPYHLDRALATAQAHAPQRKVVANA